MSIPKDTTTVRVVREFVTRERAKQLWEYNTDNRHYYDAHAQEYANFMKTDTWYDVGDANVKITKSGRVIDGQHTLMAIRKTGKGIWLRIAYDLPEIVHQVLDTGKKRTVGDFLRIEKFPNSIVLGSAIRLILLYQSGKSPVQNKDGRSRLSITNKHIIDYAHANRMELKDIITDSYKIHTEFRHLPPSSVAFLQWIFRAKNKTMNDEFFDAYATGYDSKGERLLKEHPIAVARAKLFQDAKTRNYSLRDKLAICVYAWNHLRHGDRKINGIQLKDGYEFPRAK